MKSKEIRSKITDKAKLELSIEEVEVKKPVGNEVLLKCKPVQLIRRSWSFVSISKSQNIKEGESKLS